MKLAKFQAIILFLALINNACTGTRPDDLGIQNNGFKNCPDKPNCVSSFANTEEHKIAPLQVGSDIAAAKTAVKAAVETMGNGKLINETENYLYFEFTSSLMKYVDDVEIYFTGADGLAHVRSASRLGYSDMGANRKRIEMIRGKLAN